jgi:UDP-glucose 4-epimerase
MRVAITGATGNVGTSLLGALAGEERVESIVGIARRRPAGGWPKTTWVEADIARDDLEQHLRGADCVVHLAWLIQPSRDEATLHATNVEGSRRVFEATARAGVPALVYASSVGAYSPGPKDRAVDESWPTDGVPTSFYSRHKAATERLLDSLEADHPELRVVRMRPGLIFKREAASEIRRYFIGPFLPSPLVRRSLIPVVPRIDRLRFQAVHSLDIGEAYRLAIVSAGARGAYNVAADPVLDPDRLARLLRARAVRIPAGLLRAAADLTWRLRLQPTPPGWVDMALGVPIMSTARIREELGWQPQRTSEQALLDLLAGLRDESGADTPPLSPRAGGRLRLRELRTGVGARSI